MPCMACDLCCSWERAAGVPT